MFRLVGTVVAIIVCADLLVGLLLADVNINPAADMFLDLAALSICTAVALWFVVLAPLRGDAMRERAVTLRRELDLLDDAQRQEFDARVHRAMEMAGTEAVAHRAVARALQRGTNRLSAGCCWRTRARQPSSGPPTPHRTTWRPAARSPRLGSVRRSAAAKRSCSAPPRTLTPVRT